VNTNGASGGTAGQNYVLGQYYYGIGVAQSTPYLAQGPVATVYNQGALPALPAGSQWCS
jgi:hypothetical protein